MGMIQFMAFKRLEDISETKKLWIHEVNPRAKYFSTFLKENTKVNLAGFLDDTYQDDFEGYPVVSPTALEGDQSNTAVVLTSFNVNPILKTLMEAGLHTIYFHRSLMAFLMDWEQMRTYCGIAYIPSVSGKPPHPNPDNWDDVEDVLAMIEAKYEILYGDIEAGHAAIRRLAFDKGMIFLEDRLAYSAFYEKRIFAELIDYYNEAVREGLLPFNDVRQQQLQAIERKVPPIYMNTMLKSGTVFLQTTLMEKLNIPIYALSAGTHSSNWLHPEYTKVFAEGGAIAVRHASANEHNLHTLHKAGVRKIYLHIRDPRQATLSYINHIDRNLVDDQYTMRNLGDVPLPANYDTFAMNEKIAWHTRHHTPSLIHWLTEWFYVAKNDPRFDILMVDYNFFREHELTTVQMIIDFFELDIQITETDLPKKDEKVHFHKGDPDAWRQKFTPKQQHILWSLIPEDIKTHFGWQP